MFPINNLTRDIRQGIGEHNGGAHTCGERRESSVGLVFIPDTLGKKVTDMIGFQTSHKIPTVPLKPGSYDLTQALPLFSLPAGTL